MRHPPRSALLVVGAAVALVGTAIAPVVTASGATPACTVDYSVTSQWDTGFQGAVKITNNRAALSGWSLTFDFANGQKVGQGWNAKWSQSATTVTAANESWNGALGSGASVSAGFLASWSGSNAVPTTFKLNGTTCNVDTEPSPTPTDPPPTTGTAPELHVSGNKLVDAGGTTRRLLGVNRSGGEFMCVQGYGIFDGPVDHPAGKGLGHRESQTGRNARHRGWWV
ncbi:cellulose-binding domain-containing protein, partial [Streptomyces mirabilis]|uniref:cellulose-binding domain-containing protein n=1 Tax=Streptomyces mirabilis TaxID=68239 RepID=UPI0036B15682